MRIRLRPTGKFFVVTALAIASLMMAASPAVANVGQTGTSAGGGYGSSSNPKMQFVVDGQAAPDECWVAPADPSVASEYGQYVAPTGYDTNGGVVCPSGSQPKVNQAYVWGLSQTTNGKGWFGTVANTLCLVEGGYLGITSPLMNDTSVCEFGQGRGTTEAGLPAILGDWRPPELFTFTIGARNQPTNLLAGLGATDQATVTYYLNRTLGIRSATAVADPLNPGHQVVFFAGPTLTGTGLTLLAFRDDGSFVGATFIPGFNDIRKWVSTGGVVYAGVGKVSGGGAVVQWVPPAVAGDSYFTFAPIAVIPGDVAELTLAGSQLVAGTWPSGAGSMASLYVSPAGTPIGSLTIATPWTKVWQASDYEPDSIVAATYGTGAMSYFGGYVYWAPCTFLAWRQ